jgi:hypothetical protein
MVVVKGVDCDESNSDPEADDYQLYLVKRSVIDWIINRIITLAINITTSRRVKTIASIDVYTAVVTDEWLSTNYGDDIPSFPYQCFDGDNPLPKSLIKFDDVLISGDCKYGLQLIVNWLSVTHLGQYKKYKKYSDDKIISRDSSTAHRSQYGFIRHIVNLTSRKKSRITFEDILLIITYINNSINDITLV